MAKILVIDDDTSMRRTVSRILTSAEIRSRLVEERVVVAPVGVHRLVSQLLNIVEPQVEIKVSPGKAEPLRLDDSGTIIAFGSNIYNSVTKYYLDEYYPKYRRHYSDFPYMRLETGADGGTTRFIGWHQRDNPRPHPPDPANCDPEPAFIIRFKDRTARSHRTVFICAGIRGEATVASALYLIDNWSQNFPREGDFGVKMYCSGATARPTGASSDQISHIPSAYAPGQWFPLHRTEPDG